ncbi:glycosyltransferase family 4 protein [Aquirufa aurantiipilula]|uniref:Glycosyltransferase family 1 protein n=1 Tax=Aquirufa aurantiipilula TaxID=2696561 RepID=A0ABT6BK61_9BACT|nr:glycosyltransferase family 1 protein [Aquirufa aurantiipilula]MDF5690848.1 glycosyltransferase family 1 protein [Aquirufa aurantiipilula]
MKQNAIIGIDASNIRAGGGVTHLIELLKAAEPAQYGIEKFIIWGGSKTLGRIEEKPWIQKIHHPYLDKSFLHRLYWAIFKLKKEAFIHKIDLLFVPGGSDASNFQPMVTMSQNLLPFEWKELKRYGWTFSTLKGILLRFVQGATFKKAQGVIFMTQYAQAAAIKVTGKLNADQVVIGHGINPMFDHEPQAERYQHTFSPTSPCRLLYVSGLEPYKQQWHVAEAASLLQQQGYPIYLDLVGPMGLGYQRLMETLERLDPQQRFIRYHGAVPYEELKQMYASADIGVFASTCETFGQIVTEAMSAGLPMACSNRSAMPEILEDCGIYFDPENPAEIAESLKILIENPTLRFSYATKAYQKSKNFTWEKCAHQTLGFLESQLKKYVAQS